MQQTQVGSLGQEHPLERGMAIHSSFLAWESAWTEKPGGLQSMGSQRLRHEWATKQPPPTLLWGWHWEAQSVQRHTASKWWRSHETWIAMTPEVSLSKSPTFWSVSRLLLLKVTIQFEPQFHQLFNAEWGHRGSENLTSGIPAQSETIADKDDRNFREDLGTKSLRTLHSSWKKKKKSNASHRSP